MTIGGKRFQMADAAAKCGLAAVGGAVAVLLEAVEFGNHGILCGAGFSLLVKTAG